VKPHKRTRDINKYISYDIETCLKGIKQSIINFEFGMRSSSLCLVHVMQNITQFHIKIKLPLERSGYTVVSLLNQRMSTIKSSKH